MKWLSSECFVQNSWFEDIYIGNELRRWKFQTFELEPNHQKDAETRLDQNKTCLDRSSVNHPCKKQKRHGNYNLKEKRKNKAFVLNSFMSKRRI